VVEPDFQNPAAAWSTTSQTERLDRDQRWFMAVFVVKVALGMVAFAIKPWLGLLFFAVYAVYFWREIRGGQSGDVDMELEPLKLQPRAAQPANVAVLAQGGQKSLAGSASAPGLSFTLFCFIGMALWI
jgi:cation:H+ antiporter